MSGSLPSLGVTTHHLSGSYDCDLIKIISNTFKKSKDIAFSEVPNEWAVTLTWGSRPTSWATYSGWENVPTIGQSGQCQTCCRFSSSLIFTTDAVTGNRGGGHLLFRGCTGFPETRLGSLFFWFFTVFSVFFYLKRRPLCSLFNDTGH